MIHLLQAAEIAADSTSVVPDVEKVAQNFAEGNVHWDQVISQLISWSLDAGKHILIAAVVYLIGHYLIKLLNYLLAGLLERRKVEVSVQTFVKSFVSILLQVLLIVTVVGALGVNTTSFAALLASFGVAIGMALSGNLQNFAGGIVILFLKPYKVGDWVEAQGTAGTVKAIQIFHTILMTADGKMIYIPNGAMSSGTITNYTLTPTRLAEWTIGIEYGEDVEKARRVALEIIKSDKRVKDDPAPVVWLKELNSSSVDLVIRCWVDNADYWGVMFENREKIYNRFNEEGIGFPFPQVTVHQGS
ncbi:MAG: mechanosensitive ion channel [Bacteroidaceae bacterium]|nr:mechanosensitive ion channel [Bacteroidaceae bacterium]MBR1666539.1 mechanosensitive ion channel [Bacteroidaceae bacterium]